MTLSLVSGESSFIDSWTLFLQPACKSLGLNTAHIVLSSDLYREEWLKILRTKYESENRTEEVAIVSKLIHEEEADEIREYDGF